MVDHIRAPKGDQTLFWDRSNWQPFARVCNTRKAIATEGGFGRPVTRTVLSYVPAAASMPLRLGSPSGSSEDGDAR